MEYLDRLNLTSPDLYNPEIEKLVRSVGIEETYPAKTLFSFPGKDINYVYYISQGRTRHYMDNEQGNVKLLYTLTQGWFFGETPFILGVPSNLYSETEIETTIFLIPAPQCRKLLAESELFRDAMLKCMAHKALIMRYETANLCFNSCKDRLRRLLCASADTSRVVDSGWYGLKIHYTHYGLSEIVGSTRVTVSRHLAELYKEGFLRTVNQTLQVSSKSYHLYTTQKKL